MKITMNNDMSMPRPHKEVETMPFRYRLIKPPNECYMLVMPPELALDNFDVLPYENVLSLPPNTIVHSVFFSRTNLAHILATNTVIMWSSDDSYPDDFFAWNADPQFGFDVNVKTALDPVFEMFGKTTESSGAFFGSIGKTLSEISERDLLLTGVVCVIAMIMVIQRLGPDRGKMNTVTKAIMGILVGCVLIAFIKTLTRHFTDQRISDKDEEGICKDPFILHEIWSTLRHYYTDEYGNYASQMDPQFEWIEHGDEGVDTFKSKMIGMMLRMTSMVLNVHVRSNFVEGILNHCKMHDSVFDNASSIIIDVSNAFAEFLSTNTGPNAFSRFFHVGRVGNEEACALLRMHTKLIAAVVTGDPITMVEFPTVYDTTVKETLSLIKRLGRNEREASRMLEKSLNELRLVHRKHMTESVSANGPRIEPVAMLFKGVPNTCKTELLNRISRVLVDHTLPEIWKDDYQANPAPYIYNCPHDKFFDTYSNKAWVAKKDDIFQAKDSVGDKDSDALFIIKSVNTAPYPLPMASVNEKNAVFFRSPFLLASTNLTNFNLLHSVIDSKAVSRRFAIEINVSINRKYKNEAGQVVFPKWHEVFDDDQDLPDYIDFTVVPNDFWELMRVYRYPSGEVHTESITLKDLILLAISEHKKRVAHYQCNLATSKLLSKEIGSEFDIPRTELVRGNQPIVSKTLDCQSGFLSTMPGMFEIRERSESPSSVLSDSVKSANGLCHWDCFSSNTMAICEHTTWDYFYVSSKQYNKRELSAILHNALLRDHENRQILVNALYVRYGFEKFVDEEEAMEILADCTLLIHKPEFYKKYKGWINQRACLAREHKENFVHLLVDLVQKMVQDSVNFENGEIYIPAWKVRMHEATKTMKNYSVKVASFVRSNYLYLTVGFVLVTGIIAAFVAFFTRTIGHEIDSQSIDVEKLGKRSKPRNLNLKDRISRRPNETKFQGMDELVDVLDHIPLCNGKLASVHTNVDDILKAILRKHFYICYLTKTNNEGGVELRKIGHAVNVRNNYFAFPLHFAFSIDALIGTKKMTRDDNIILQTTNNRIRYTVPISDFKQNVMITEESCNQDLCLFKVKEAQVQSKGIYNYLLHTDDLKRLDNQKKIPSCLVTTNRYRGDVLGVVVHNVNAVRANNDLVVNATWDEDATTYHVPSGYRYESRTSYGDCGSLLYYDSNQFQSRVVYGMHIAGDGKSGASTILTAEFIDSIIASEGVDIPTYDEEENPYYVEYPDLTCEARMEPIGKLKSEFCISDARVSTIVKSKIYDKITDVPKELREYPARLLPFEKDGVRIDPYDIAKQKYFKYPPPIMDMEISKAIDSYETLLHKYDTKRSSGKIRISLEESLHAFENVNAVNSGTSAGFPMTCRNEDNLKKMYYKAIHDNDVDQERKVLQRIASAVDNALNKMDNGIRPAFIYKDNLKDETRPYDKVVEGKTRLFSGSPFILLVMFRMFFGSFIDFFFEANLDIGSAIGINPYSLDWDRLARYLLKFSSGNKTFENIGAGDYKEYDSSQYTSIHNAILEMINRWYGPNDPDNKYRFLLWYEITNSYHVFNNEVYCWEGKLPSGNPLTAIINTIYNNTLIRIAWVLAELPIEFFNDNVYVAALGDDIVFSVAPAFVDQFNELTLPTLYSKIGLIYTHETKGSHEFKFRNIFQVDFLKRSFKYDKALNRWVAPINRRTLYNTLMWTQKSPLKHQITVDNMSFVLREMSLHGHREFDHWRKKLLALCEEFYPDVEPHEPFPNNWDQAYRKILNSDFKF